MKEIALIFVLGLMFRSWLDPFPTYKSSMSWVDNKNVDVLANLASKIDVPDELINVSMVKKILRPTIVDLILANPID